MSFAEVVAQTMEVQEAGVGYVNAADNDDYARGLYGIIDLDGVLDENGEPMDWVPSLAAFDERDAYVEYSPSGDGLHIPVVGMEAPDWWSDSHFSDDEHQGIEVLTNKFATFTGNQLDDSGDSVVEYGEWLDDWLEAAYEAVNGESPRSHMLDAPDSASGGTSTDYEEDWLTEDRVEEALDHIDPNCGYAAWRNIGFALGSEFSARRAERLMDGWSRGGSSYDDDTPELIEDIVNRDDGGITIGTLIKRAKDGGWDPGPDHPHSSEPTPTPAELVVKHSDDIDSVDELPDDFFDDSDEDADEDEPEATWEMVRQMFMGADGVDDRLPVRWQATEILNARQHWRALVENDVLYHYDVDAGIYRNDGEIRLRETLVQELQEQFRVSEQSEIAEQLRGRNMITQERMGGPTEMVCTQNCVLDLSGDRVETQPHDPSHEFLNRVETEYDESADCPRFRAFLEDVVQTGAQRKKLQEYAGYVLHHWGLPHHKTLFLVGPTASGKSTFLDTLRSMIGGDAVASLTPQQMTQERFGGAELHGAWANIRNDIPSETVKNTGQFKEIAAGDPMKAEEKYQDPFHFEPTAKHLFSANQLPETNTDDEAFYRRILLCAFPNTIPRAERDTALDEKLEAELPGVLNWAIEGLQRLQIQGRFTADRIPGETQDTWEKWANSITRFLKIGLEDEPGSAVPKSTAYAAYTAYCEAEGIPTETQHKMTRKFKRNDVQSGRRSIEGKQQRCYLDVELSSRGVDLLNLDSFETATGDGGGGIDDY
jgi:putative DNA primase/helicase